ncbi:MAG: terminase gpA endonuclease subunit, partial [Thermoguttaceae bacterium]
GSAHLARGQMYLGVPTEINMNADTIRFPTMRGNPSSGATVIAAGIGSAIRGKFCEGPNGETLRPDFVLIDDLQTDTVAKNPLQVDSYEKLIETALEGLAEDGKRISMLMTCTVMRAGDLADRYLNHKRHPHWQGLRFRMLEEWPKNLEMWDTYRHYRQESVNKANEYYYQNQAKMDEGAVVAWEESFDARFERNALHHAMNLRSDDESAFAMERQNEPLEELAGDSIVNTETILTRLNGLEQGVVPKEAVHLTAFIDVHDDILYFTVVAWGHGFTGWIIDYGTFPKQKSRYFGKRDKSNKTLRDVYPDDDVNTRIEKGINSLVTQLLDNCFRCEGGDGYKVIDQILIDRGFKPDQVENAILTLPQELLPKVDPSIGRGFSAAKCPIKNLQGDYIEEKGTFWYRGTPESGYGLDHYTLDTNYWKGSVHESLSLDPKITGSLSLWGKDPERHRMFAEHCTSEDAELHKANGREMYEFRSEPNINNHFFDCVTGAKAAASIIGLRK